MKISKHIHACLLVEDQEKTVLLDPGNFTVKEQALDVDKVKKLDHILITHEHDDHCYAPLIKQLLEKFSTATVISNEGVKKKLKSDGIEVTTMGTEQILLEEVPHEKLWGSEAPPNTMFHVFGRLSHPGDSHHFQKVNDVLALPISAPWGSTTDAVNLALQLKPKYIIPIHDWLLKDEVLKMMYPGFVSFFQKHDIQFLPLETGEIIEI